MRKRIQLILILMFSVTLLITCADHKKKKETISKYSIKKALKPFIANLKTHAIKQVKSKIKVNHKLNNILYEFDSYVSSMINGNKIPGAAIAIVTKDKILYMKGFGVRKVGQPDPINTKTVFPIASLSKGFASTLTGLLVEDGILNWHDKVIKYLPFFSFKKSKNTVNLTINNVLSHTSGIVPHAYDNLIEAGVPFGDVLKKMKDAPIVGSVGKIYGYQNVIYSLISKIIKVSTNKNYTDLLKQRIVKPLDMANVSFDKESLTSSGNYASPHIKMGEKWRPTKMSTSYYALTPAAGINASIEDMAKWTQALLGSKPNVISTDLIQEICTPIIETPVEKRRYNSSGRLSALHYGKGFRISRYSRNKIIFHGGALRGYLSYMAFLPHENIGIVILQNSWPAKKFIYKFLDLYLEKNTVNKKLLKL